MKKVRSVRGSSRASPLFKKSSEIFSYHKKLRTSITSWSPINYHNWVPLIKRFGTHTPIREFCKREVFLSVNELELTKIAYRYALEVVWRDKGKPFNEGTAFEVEKYFRGALFI
jgi:hypothetical protein